MKLGEIVVEHASRRFRVYPRPTRTLKDLVITRGRLRGTDVWALRDVSFEVEPSSALALVGRNGSGKTTLLRLLSAIIKPTEGHVAVGGRVGSLLELGAGFHPELSGRENVFLQGSIHGLKRALIREKLDEIVAFAELEKFIDVPVRTYSSGMYLRLGFAIAAHMEADVLLLDEVFAVGDESFQRKCFGKIFEFKQRGGTIVFVSHDAAAVERLCDRAVLLKQGRVAFDGPTHEAIIAYRRLLVGERDPEERRGGLREWGGVDGRLDGLQLLGPDGDPRRQYLAGEPIAVALRVVLERSLDDAGIVWQLRDATGILLASGAQQLEELGLNGTGELALRFEIPEPPFADGTFHLRFDLVAGGEPVHSLDDALSFVVYPSDDARGLMRVDGRWSAELKALA